MSFYWKCEGFLLVCFFFFSISRFNRKLKHWEESSQGMENLPQSTLRLEMGQQLFESGLDLPWEQNPQEQGQKVEA